jgi:hypothetical protein
VRSGSTALELFGFKDDEVFVDGLQGGVGEAGGAVEEAAFDDVEKDEFDERAAWEAVEEFLLVEAALVKIFHRERGTEMGEDASGGCVGLPVGEDLLGLKGGVLVVAVEPVAVALAEGVVIEIAGDAADGAVGDGDGVDEALVAQVGGKKEAQVEGRGLDVFEPGAVEEVAALYAEGHVLAGVVGGVLEAAFEFGGDALVGVEVEDPGVLEGEIGDGPVLMGGPVVEGALVGVGSGSLCDGEGVVGAEGVEDVDVVGPGYGGEAGGEVLLLVAGEDEDGDHLWVWYRGAGARRGSIPLLRKLEVAATDSSAALRNGERRNGQWRGTGWRWRRE